MLRTSLAFMSVALLLASPAGAQTRGGGGCASGSSAAGAMSRQLGVAVGGGTSFMGSGANLGASYSGPGNISNASTTGAMATYGTNASTAAAYYNTGVVGYDSAAWSSPYATTDNVYGNSSVGFGLMNDMNDGPMNGMTDGFSSIAANEFNPPGDGFAAAEQISTDTTPRTRSRSKKSQSKLRHRSKRTAGAPH
jgi:hypothetical protein